MIEALLEVLFKASGGQNATFCIPGKDACFEAPQGYLNDNITEKVPGSIPWNSSIIDFSTFFPVEIVYLRKERWLETSHQMFLQWNGQRRWHWHVNVTLQSVTIQGNW